MFCNECGESLPAGSKFCPKCGKAVADAGTSAGEAADVTAGSDAEEAKAEATAESEESTASTAGVRASAAGSGGVVEFKNSPRETFFVGFVLVLFGICGLTDELNVF